MTFVQYIGCVAFALTMLLIAWILDGGDGSKKDNDIIDIERLRKTEDNSGVRW